MAIFVEMPPAKDKARKELSFTKEEIEQFEKLAAKDGRSLKNWMENQLRKLLPRKKQ